MFESILKAGASFDWITPLFAFIQNYWYRPAVGYIVPLEYAATPELLKSKGIKLWGIVIVGNEVVFCLRLAQAGFAQYWMERNGIPYQGGATDAEIAKVRRTGKSTSVLDNALDGIDKLIGGI